MNWNSINSSKHLDEIIELSKSSDCLILKHSTTCPISSMAKMRLESKWDSESLNIKPFYLDLLSYRPISNEIAERFNVHHESPQILLIRNGECIYDESHMDISVDEIKSVLDYENG